MGSAERIRVAAQLASAEQARRPVAIVVSAMSKVTDLLLDSLRKAEAGDQADLDRNLLNLSVRHVQACQDLLPAERHQQALAQVEELVEEFARIAKGILMLGERPPKSVDEAIAIGERLSAFLMAEYLESQGIAARAVNAAEVIATDAVFGNATPLMDQTRVRAAQVLAAIACGWGDAGDHGLQWVDAGWPAYYAGARRLGFFGVHCGGGFGRAGIWIWTDVDGIMSADPRLVPNAKVLDEVTYAEAAELAYNGAKVLHPRTLAPLAERLIPVWSKNSFAPEKPGTRIVPKLSLTSGARWARTRLHPWPMSRWSPLNLRREVLTGRK